VNQQEFESQNRPLWRALEDSLENPDRNSDNFPRNFRKLCHQLALAKSRSYSLLLVDELNSLALRCHHKLYQKNRNSPDKWLHFLVYGFPNALRRNSIFLIISATLFAGPLFSIGLACYMNDEFIYSVSSPIEVNNYESMYNPANEKFGRERESDSDIFMFGFYIKNNIGISFRMFAGGLLFGLGSAFFLVYNGILIGAVSGHLAQVGYGETFFPFVISHGAFELTALVFSGAAGLRLGYALLSPGKLRRIDALQAAGRDAIQIIYGSTLMLLIAAFLEAFWSASGTVPVWLKYLGGSCLWLLVFYYCAYAGRRNGP